MTLLDRFWRNVDESGECWLWRGYRIGTGYGYIGMRRKKMLAHRLSWELAHAAEVPPGMLVCHRCDVRLCVRPDHLFIGTPEDNMADMFSKGRNYWPARLLTVGGETMPLARWARRLGISKQLIMMRLKRGMDHASAMAPPRHYRPRAA